MRAAWKVFCLFAVVLAAALGVAHQLVSDVVAVAFAEKPQPSWAVMTAFFLRAVEIIAASVAMIALAVIVGGLVQRRLLGR
jgi:hypothetical protein